MNIESKIHLVLSNVTVYQANRLTNSAMSQLGFENYR